MDKSFAVTWDYRCPFARIAHDHVVTGLEGGASWDVRFQAFSLDQAHIAEGQPPVWADPERYPGILANLAGIVVRDRHPEQFLSVHQALFVARHEQSLDLRDRTILSKVLTESGVDGSAVMAEMDAGWPLGVLEAEHTESVERHQVFGVPTFIVGDSAVFVRLMSLAGGDAGLAVSTVDRILDLMTAWPDLNEFKHTQISR
jgi:hypothetical protein